MEILKETVETVTLTLPTANTTAVTATYSTDYHLTESNLTVTLDSANGVARATLPYQISEGVLFVTWSFTIPSSGTYTKVERYDVVTPYLPLDWIKSNLLENSTDAEIKDAEAAARNIIQAHTGQYFGFQEGVTKTTYGADKNTLRLPARLVNLTTINGSVDTTVNITGNGWFLEKKYYGIPPVKADNSGINIVTAPIYDPYDWRVWSFPRTKQFDIAGDWGYEYVPTAVVEAMKLLVNDYACGDAQYRDRYLTSMTAADWRIQFHSGAFVRTGNVRADQLLADYVLQRGWAVI